MPCSSSNPDGGVTGRSRRAARSLLTLLLLLTSVPGLAGLEDELGRNESRVYSAAVPVPFGQRVLDSSLLERLEARGYRRVHERPAAPGEFFFGTSIFWIFRSSYSIGADRYDARLFGMTLSPDGVITGVVDADGSTLEPKRARLEPLLLSESLDADRAPRIPIRLDELPDHVWRPVLAAEDHRFFEHSGLDGMAIARALLANLERGEVAQGGSTITQQLVKNRDLSPKRSLGRKASEALRALALESEFPKEEILEAYLNSVYMGHVSGLAIHGFGAAARAYFSIDATRLDLAQAATLAALIQGPNRLHPLRHPDRLVERRDWVIGRMEELDWIDADTAAAVRRQPLRPRPTHPSPPAMAAFIRWAAEVARDDAPRRARNGRGLVVESSLDPLLQRAAEHAVGSGLRRMRSGALAGTPLQAALVALDVETGDVLAYVGSDPADPDAFDRARSARRQPGSTVKPLLLLETFQDCGRRSPLHPATRVADEPVTISLPSGDWSPGNPDGGYRGTVNLRTALVQSLNVPFVRVAAYCGFDEVEQRMRRAGLPLPPEPPPSFVLGSVETSPLQLARAYTAVASPGAIVQPRPVLHVSAPGGRGIERHGVRRDRVVGAASAYLVDWLLVEAVESGTARAAAVPGVRVAAKTGTSSGGRDAWLAGHAGGVVAVVWVGRDDDGRLGMSGGTAAAPIWREFAAVASRARPAREVPRPDAVVEAFVDPATGLRVKASRRGAEPFLFRRGEMPRAKRPILRDPPEPIIE